LRLKIALVLIALALVAAVLTGKKTAKLSAIEGDDKQPAAGGPRIPVLVELFTSEGCSSCPPADELLTRLEQTQPVDGAQVIALSEHVDYWNRLGWTDPYSSSEFSARQNDYARAFDTDGVYTPQMVVDGHTPLVGSDSGRARKAIASGSRDSKAAVTLSLDSEDTRAGSITLDVRAERPQSVSEGDSAEVLLAITESGLRSSVSRGENAGRRLSHTAVVRKLMPLGSVDSRGGAQFVAKPVVQIDKGWKRDSLKAVVFVQERISRRVLGASSVSLGK
jgi:hypothetical protein